MTDQVDLCNKLHEFATKSLISKNDWDDLNELIMQVHVPENTVIEIRPFEPEDFSSIPSTAKQCFNTIKSVFSNLTESDYADKYSKEFLKCVYSIILLCGEHSSENVWTNDECVELSNNVLKIVLKALKCENLISFLMKTDDKRKFHGINVFLIMLPKLSNETWKFYPSLVQCYSWLLHFIEMPNMKEYINLILPVSLIILSDYTIESKILGLECLRHSVSNVSKAELHWHVQIEVLQKVLKPLFYYREWDLIVPLIKCTLEIVDKSKSGFKDSNVDLQWSYFDEVLNIFLPMMEHEQDILRRQAYAQSLCLILKSSDFVIGRWSERLLKIIQDYSKMSDTQLNALQALNSYIRICWPLVESHWRLITVIAGRVVYRSTNEAAIIEAEYIFQVLKELLPDKPDLMDIEYIKKRREESKSSNDDSE